MTKESFKDGAYIYNLENESNICFRILTKDKNTRLLNKYSKNVLGDLNAEDSIYQNLTEGKFKLETEKPIIILQHGISSNFKTFSKAAKYLANDFVVIMPNLPDHRASEKIKDKHPLIFDYSEPIYQTLRRMEVKKASFISSSLGATVITNLAENHPDIVNNLILSEPHIYAGDVPKGNLIKKLYPLLKAIVTLNGRDKQNVFTFAKKIQTKHAEKAGANEEVKIYKTKRYVLTDGEMINFVYAVKKRKKMKISEKIPISILLAKNGMAKKFSEKKNELKNYFETIKDKFNKYFSNHLISYLYVDSGHHPHREEKSVLSWVNEITKECKKYLETKSDYISPAYPIL